MILFEAVVESSSAARAAAAGGAQRLEICVDLSQGGLTPPAEIVTEIASNVTLPLHVMIRPRGGEFVARGDDLARAERQLAALKEFRPAAFVFGFLDRAGSVHREGTRRLVDLARPATVTFHRAFDRTADPYQALEDLIEIGVDRVLTSGGAPTAFEGRETLRRLVGQASDRIVIMAGGGVRPTNWREIVRATGVSEIHGSVPIDTRVIG